MIRAFGRVAAAVALLLAMVAVVTVATNSTAGAANTNVTANCSTAPAVQTINNSDTLTITVGAGCGAVILIASGGGTATWMPSFPLTQGSPIGGLQQGDTVVFTAPASGSGSAAIGFMATAQSMPPAIAFTVNFPTQAPGPSRNDSLTDNGDGSMTVTYSPVTQPSSVWVSLFPSGTTCNPGGVPTGRLYLLGPGIASNPFTSSPAVVAAGTGAMTGQQPLSATTIAAGSYQACMYYNPGQQTTLVQSLAVTLGVVTPTTTAPADDPVVPAFTG